MLILRMLRIKNKVKRFSIFLVAYLSGTVMGKGV